MQPAAAAAAQRTGVGMRHFVASPGVVRTGGAAPVAAAVSTALPWSAMYS